MQISALLEDGQVAEATEERRITKRPEKARGVMNVLIKKKWIHIFTDFCDFPLMCINMFIVN